jgi:transposase-like protein
MANTSTISCSIEGCDKPHSSRGWCKEHYDRYLRWGDPLGKWEPKQVVTYAGAHDRVKASRGLAKDHECAHCSNPAVNWAYDHLDSLELREVLYVASVKSYDCPYSADPNHYIPLCRSCHWRVDHASELQRVTLRRVRVRELIESGLSYREVAAVVGVAKSTVQDDVRSFRLTRSELKA